LGIELSGLYFHALVTEDGGSVNLLVDSGLETTGSVPLLLIGLGKLDLDTIHAVYAVNEENQDEDECNLHPIL